MQTKISRIPETNDEIAAEMQNEGMIELNSLPLELRDFVIDSDQYTIDEDGNVYDPYYKEYPSEDQIKEQMEYQREKVQ